MTKDKAAPSSPQDTEDPINWTYVYDHAKAWVQRSMWACTESERADYATWYVTEYGDETDWSRLPDHSVAYPCFEAFTSRP